MTFLRSSLGPPRYERFNGFAMRIGDHFQLCVTFLGYPQPRDVFLCQGTGFFLSYEGVGYLVTARHVAKVLGDVGWGVRLNRKDGGSTSINAENVRWTYHSDPNVDLAVTNFGLRPDVAPDYEIFWVQNDWLLTDARLQHHLIGPGDPCYTIGLFHLLTGAKRNLPVVHTGNLALMPGDELVPIKDWDDETKTRFVRAYLVESQSMPGLSGSPVFVRPSFALNGLELNMRDGTREMDAAIMTRDRCLLLGVFQAAWQAKPSEIIAVDRGRPVVVPVGMGVVVPAQRIVEICEMPELKNPRDEFLSQQALPVAATPASLPPPVKAKSEPPTTEIKGDEKHRERFTALLDEAVGKPRQGG